MKTTLMHVLSLGLMIASCQDKFDEDIHRQEEEFRVGAEQYKREITEEGSTDFEKGARGFQH